MGWSKTAAGWGRRGGRGSHRRVPRTKPAKKGALQLAPERPAAAKGLQCEDTGGRWPSTHGAAPAAGGRREPLDPRLRKSIWCRASCNLQRRGRRKEEGKRLTVSYTLRGKTQHFPGHQEAAGIYYKLIFYRTPSSGKTAGVVKFAGCFPSLCELACLQLLRVS